jgi:hypothetical protein
MANHASAVVEWGKRTSTADRPMAPQQTEKPHLSEIDEAIVVDFRRRNLLPVTAPRWCCTTGCWCKSTPHHHSESLWCVTLVPLPR